VKEKRHILLFGGGLLRDSGKGPLFQKKGKECQGGAASENLEHYAEHKSKT